MGRRYHRFDRPRRVRLRRARDRVGRVRRKRRPDRAHRRRRSAHRGQGVGREARRAPAVVPRCRAGGSYGILAGQRPRSRRPRRVPGLARVPEVRRLEARCSGERLALEAGIGPSAPCAADLRRAYGDRRATGRVAARRRVRASEACTGRAQHRAHHPDRHVRQAVGCCAGAFGERLRLRPGLVEAHRPRAHGDDRGDGQPRDRDRTGGGNAGRRRCLTRPPGASIAWRTARLARRSSSPRLPPSPARTGSRSLLAAHCSSPTPATA